MSQLLLDQSQSYERLELPREVDMILKCALYSVSVLHHMPYPLLQVFWKLERKIASFSLKNVYIFSQHNYYKVILLSL